MPDDEIEILFDMMHNFGTFCYEGPEQIPEVDVLLQRQPYAMTVPEMTSD